MSRYIFLLVLAGALLSGCAKDRTSGTVREVVRLNPGERIVVLWSAGRFQDPYVHELMLKDGTYEKPYELCTNAWIERTFRLNGYPVLVQKVGPGDRPMVPRDVRYLLVIANKGAGTTALRSGQGAAQGFGIVTLEMQVDLRDRGSGKSLWSGREVFSTDARRNATPVVRIVRGLAADGYLARGPEDIRDYAGRIHSDEDLPACPI